MGVLIRAVWEALRRRMRHAGSCAAARTRSEICRRLPFGEMVVRIVEVGR